MHPTTIFLEKMGVKQGCWNSTSSTTPIKVYRNTPFLTVKQIHITRLLQPGYHILYGQIWLAIYTVIVQDSASSEMRESTWDVSISLILALFQACHQLHLLLMLRCQRNQHRPSNNLLRKAHGCSSNPAGLQYSYATRNTCPIHLYYN